MKSSQVIASVLGQSLVICGVFAGGLSGCAHGGKSDVTPAQALGLKQVEMKQPVTLRLKADPARSERVSYFHRARSVSFEDNQIRHQKEETLEFTSQAETLKVDAARDRFTQVITVIQKDGTADLHEFAMPEPGEKLDLVADSRGRILKAGDYPNNSIFFVPPISLPEEAVAPGDTWVMRGSWLSLGEMVPYQLEMVSILKRFVKCGTHTCAEIELSGEVGLQGAIAQVMAFRSLWKGFSVFDMDAGTVLWSRVDSEEQFSSGNVHRAVSSCLEALLTEPSEIKLSGKIKPACQVEVASP